MDQSTAIIFAAVIAAVITIINTSIVLASADSRDRRNATRDIIQDKLNSVGKCIHETIALSDLLTKSTNEDTHKKRYQRAAAAAQSLKDIRLEIRYSIWGIDEGIRVLTRTPDWLSHAQNDNKYRDKILRDAKELGSALDGAIRNVYASGRLPSLLTRTIVTFRAQQLRNTHKKFMADKK